MNFGKLNLGKVYSAEGAFCLGGLFFIAMAFLADVSAHLAFVDAEAGHAHGGGDVFLRVNLPVMGLALICFGLGMVILNEHRDRTHFLAYVTGLLVLTDGIAHLFAISDHINVPVYAALFTVVAVVQVGGGVLFPFLPRQYDRYWLGFTIGLIAVYAASRSFALPPLWNLEAVDPLGVFSKAVEVLTLFPLTALLRGERAVVQSAPATGAAEP